MNASVIQKAHHKDDSHKHAAIIEIDGVRFFSVTPGTDTEAENINYIFRDAVVRPLGMKFTPAAG